jgi:predicted phage-related endonuclease
MATKVISQEIVIESVILRGNVGKAAQALVEARALKAQAEKAEAVARAVVVEYLTSVGATKGTVKNVTVTLRSETQNRVDSKGLREVYPEIAQAFTKEIAITKVITN